MCKLLFIFVAVALVCVSEGRTIRWTAAGGTALWDFSRNWDCQCLPTADDDVIIDVPNIPGTVRIAANPATCKSLTVGGSSQFGQSLYIQGQLSIGSGGAVINPNGDISLDSSPSAPLVCDGVFSGSNRFQFRSGTIAGKGQFVFESINMTTPALKQINASTTVRGLLWVLPGAGQNALLNVAQQTLQVAGTLQTEEALTIFSDDGQSASLEVSGNLNFNGAGKSFIIRGYAAVSKLNVLAGSLTIQNSVDITAANIASGASITIIGGPENIRNFGNVTGDGTLVVQGGANTIKGAKLGTLQIVSGKLSSDSPLAFANLGISGGELAGKAVVTASSTTLGSATISGVSLTSTNVDIGGFTTINGGSFTITTSGKVSASGQFTLNAGATFAIGASAAFTQANPFGLVPGADVPLPVVNHDGSWTASSTSSIVVPVQGNGKWILNTGSEVDVTGNSFSTNSIAVAGTIKFLGVTGTIGTLSGTGYVELNGKTFAISTSSVGTINQINGQTTIAGSIGNLTIANGNFVVSSKLAVTSLNFTAGTIQGPTSGGASLSVKTASLSGAAPKFINAIQVVSSAINWDCSGASCQVVQNNAVFKTGATN